jgi:hypothetical protein
VAESSLEVLSFDPLIDYPAGYVDILSEGVKGVTAQKQTVEESRLALRGLRIEIVGR